MHAAAQPIDHHVTKEKKISLSGELLTMNVVDHPSPVLMMGSLGPDIQVFHDCDKDAGHNEDSDEVITLPERRLETKFLGGGLYEHHVGAKSSRETWRRTLEIGHGNFGRVYLEKCIATHSEGRSRAVKEVPKYLWNQGRELKALAIFSQVSVTLHNLIRCRLCKSSMNSILDNFMAGMQIPQHTSLPWNTSNSEPWTKCSENAIIPLEKIKQEELSHSF